MTEYEQRYNVEPEDERPAFAKELWKEIIDSRDVGPNRRQALGGLHPKFADVNPNLTQPSRSSYSGPFFSQQFQAGPSNEDFNKLSKNVEMLVGTMSHMHEKIDYMER